MLSRSGRGAKPHRLTDNTDTHRHTDTDRLMWFVLVGAVSGQQTIVNKVLWHNQ
jgi:hypothetical protein